MTDDRKQPGAMDWTHPEARARQSRAGLRMTAAERLAWLEEMLDELLPLVGRARSEEQRRTIAREGRS